MTDSVRAICILRGDNVNGVVLMAEDLENKQTVIKVKINGLSPGKHGFHIHQSGDTRNGCDSMGSHYNPYSKKHGGLESKVRHVGDLGNVVADKNGKVDVTLVDKLVKLRGKYSVIGRSMVVHADEDDLGLGNHVNSKTTGNSGSRLACGIIGIL